MLADVVGLSVDMARLIVFAGLPGTGKSTLAREVARRTGALWLRVDSIEAAIRASGVVPGDLRDAGYRVAYAMAGDNLRLGRVVIADCVNDWKLVRDAWQAAGERASAEVRWIEIVCSDLVEHRRRVETRVSEVPGLVLPDWRAVIGREYHAWHREHVVIDTAGRRIEDCVAAVMTALGDGAAR